MNKLTNLFLLPFELCWIGIGWYKLVAAFNFDHSLLSSLLSVLDPL